eukprot:11012474-Alexandrium_andersonii.AAC.1
MQYEDTLAMRRAALRGQAVLPPRPFAPETPMHTHGGSSGSGQGGSWYAPSVPPTAQGPLGQPTQPFVAEAGGRPGQA